MILVFGSINIDLLIAAPRLPAAGETVLGESYRQAPGGKGANQALAAARAGAQVTLVGAVGADAFAAAALTLLREAGVELALETSAERPTGCAAITVAQSGENMITVAAGANLLARAAMVAEERLGPETTVLLQMEVPPAEVALLAGRAKRHGSRVILNLVPAQPLAEETLRQLDMLVVNESEARALPLPPATLAAQHRLTVVETRGEKGAVAWLAEGSEIAVPALRVPVVDTTGAGDAFVGILAASLDAGLDLTEALRRASAGAALACGAVGAQPSMPHRDAIDAAAKRLGGGGRD